MIPYLSGLGIAVITPFNDNDEVDYDSLDNVISYLLANDVDFLVLSGTTGENPTLSLHEKEKILRFVINKTKNKVPIVLGVGGYNTKEVISEIKEFENINEIFAFLCVTPYYNKPTQEGLYLHYSAIAKSTKKKLIIYNVPTRTACNINASTIKKLIDNYKNIYGIKEASHDARQINSIFLLKSDDFKIFSGDDSLTFLFLKLGGDGLISVAGNAFPSLMKKFINCIKNNNLNEAIKINQNLNNIFNYLFYENSPAAIKWIMYKMKLIKSPKLRLPITQISEDLKEKINLELSLLNL